MNSRDHNGDTCALHGLMPSWIRSERASYDEQGQYGNVHEYDIQGYMVAVSWLNPRYCYHMTLSLKIANNGHDDGYWERVSGHAFPFALVIAWRALSQRLFCFALGDSTNPSNAASNSGADAIRRALASHSACGRSDKQASAPAIT